MASDGKDTTENAAKEVRISHTRLRGIDVMRDPKLNKGLAFTLEERQLVGIHGLVPPCFKTQDEQVYRVLQNFYHFESDLDRYIYLIGLQDRNEKLFYRVLTEQIELLMPIVYTPTVGLACQKYGLVFRRPRGLYITINDLGHVYEILCNWPERKISVIVVTDGERILGLGDLGAQGMGIPVGKLSLYTACAGVDPQHCLPIVIDVGTDNETLLKDPLYIGLPQKRTRGEKYDQLIEEFMQAVVKRFGQNTLIQFEDFGNSNAFRFLEKYRGQYCTFNDDIQGTAAVAVAGVLASLKITGKKLSENIILFQGAGEASIGIAHLLMKAMKEEDSSEEEALSKLWMVDSKGLLTQGRPSGGLTEHKMTFTKKYKHMSNLEEIVREVKPSIIIGAAAVPGAFTEQIIKDMASFNERPVIFALSNPTSKAECTAEQAYTITEGRCIFASGSPFQPVTVNGKTHHPGQGNNAYIFPGVGLAAILCGIRHITEDVFLATAKALANLVQQEDLDSGRVYPPLTKIRDVSASIAVEIAKYAYKHNMAAHYPEPADKDDFIRSQMYSTDYSSFVPDRWSWPKL